MNINKKIHVIFKSVNHPVCTPVRMKFQLHPSTVVFFLLHFLSHSISVTAASFEQESHANFDNENGSIISRERVNGDSQTYSEESHNYIPRLGLGLGLGLGLRLRLRHRLGLGIRSNPSNYLETPDADQYFNRSEPSSQCKWTLTSSSLSGRPFQSFNSVQLRNEWEIPSILTSELISSNPLVEFLIYRPNSSSNLLNYPTTSKIAFYKSFPTSQIDSEVSSTILTVLERDFYLSGMFLMISILNRGDGITEVGIFTKIDQNDFETIDRLFHAFSRFPLLRNFVTTSANEIIQKRIVLMNSIDDGKKSSDQFWSKFTSKATSTDTSTILTNLQVNPLTTSQSSINVQPRLSLINPDLIDNLYS